MPPEHAVDLDIDDELRQCLSTTAARVSQNTPQWTASLCEEAIQKLRMIMPAGLGHHALVVCFRDICERLWWNRTLDRLEPKLAHALQYWLSGEPPEGAALALGMSPDDYVHELERAHRKTRPLSEAASRPDPNRWRVLATNLKAVSVRRRLLAPDEESRLLALAEAQKPGNQEYGRFSDLLVELFEGGVSTEDLAKATGFHSNTIRYRLMRRRGSLSREGTVRPEEAQQLRALHERSQHEQPSFPPDSATFQLRTLVWLYYHIRNVPTPDLAEILGVHCNTVRYWLHHHERSDAA